MFANKHTNAAGARQTRQFSRFAARQVGAEERMTAAVAKRDRKNRKRLLEAFNSEVGQMQARERLTGAQP